MTIVGICPEGQYASESWVQNLYILSVNEDFKRLEKSWKIFVPLQRVHLRTISIEFMTYSPADVLTSARSSPVFIN